MPRFVAIYQVEDAARWEAGFRTRGPMFKDWTGVGTFHFTVSDAGQVVQYGEFVADMEEVTRSMQSPEGVAAMVADGVKPETMVIHILDKELPLDAMDNFKAYLAAFGRTHDWAEIAPLFDAAFHPELVVVTADGELNKEQWAEMAKGLAAKSATVSDFHMTAEEGDSVFYGVTVTVEGESMQMASKGTVKDGRIVRVEPTDPATYAALVEHSK